jgi:hypothetical protein
MVGQEEGFKTHPPVGLDLRTAQPLQKETFEDLGLESYTKLIGRHLESVSSTSAFLVAQRIEKVGKVAKSGVNYKSPSR